MTEVVGNTIELQVSLLETWLQRAGERVESSPEAHVAEMVRQALKAGVLRPVGDDTSDGYHTFGELYRHRALLTAALFNLLLAWPGMGYDPYKTRNHHPDDADPMFEGMFKVGATLPTGEITYHVPLELWDLFGIPEREHSPLWDRHTAGQVADRLQKHLGG